MSPNRFNLALAFMLSVQLAACRADERPRVELSGSVPRDGFELHYRVVGEKGPYLVILAGGPGLDVDYMASITGELAKSYRCVLLEQRGTGESKLKVIDETTINWAGYLDDVEALRKHLKEEKLTLIGHSWGMAYGLAYAAEHPDNCRAVVSVGSCPISAAYMRVFEDNRMSRLHASEREVADFWNDPKHYEQDPDRAAFETLRAITPTDFYDRKKGFEQAMLWRKAWCHARIGEVFWGKTIGPTFDLRPKLKAIACPVLFVHGYQDVTGEANMLEAKSLIKDCTLQFVHRCGHYPWLDQPEETWHTVLPFLTKVTK